MNKLTKKCKEILALVSTKKTSGKCPPEGCIVFRNGYWRIISNKTGKLWPAKYKTKKDALNALRAYQVHKK